MFIIVGSGLMAREYVKPLSGMDKDFVVVGRSVDSAKEFERETNVPVISGGIESFLDDCTTPIEGAIVAVGVEALFATTERLLNYGVTNILVEKPAALNMAQMERLSTLSNEKNSNVYVAYNRRFFNSVLAAEDIISNDGGVTSFTFELTEWSHVIETLKKAPGVKERWFLANTTHVVDLAFFLGGTPSEMTSFVSQPSEWHPAGTNFSGAGRSVTGALFSYSGNWQAPGRWGLEIMTSQSRLIFQPMEELWVQRIGSVKKEKIDLDNSLDERYKPGLYRQLDAFLSGGSKRLCSISEQLENCRLYMEMANY